jgi:DNA-binding response OmpR family regulator
MPYLSGLEIVNVVREELQLSTPIILLSKVGHEKTILRAFELGANDYVTKPFNPDELLLRVRHLLLNSNEKH